MYFVRKTFEISAAHKLKLDYQSQCSQLHGHNWVVTVMCRSEKLDANGMVIDFSTIKKMVVDRLDHKVLNDVLLFNPTAENLAKWIVDTIPHCYRAEVQESSGNWAAYEKDEL